MQSELKKLFFVSFHQQLVDQGIKVVAELDGIHQLDVGEKGNLGKSRIDGIRGITFSEQSLGEEVRVF